MWRSDPIEYLDGEAQANADEHNASPVEAAAKVCLEVVQTGSLVSEMTHNLRKLQGSKYAKSQHILASVASNLKENIPLHSPISLNLHVVVVENVANQRLCTCASYDSKWLLLQIEGVKNKMEKQPGMHSVAQPWY